MLGVRDRRDLVGAVLDGAQGAQFGRVVEQLELTALEDVATLLVVERGGLASLASSAVERYRGN